MIVASVLLMAAPPFRCGAVVRPGIAEQRSDGVWQGKAVDACRKAAGGREWLFRQYDAGTIRTASDDDMAFLNEDERAMAGIAGGGDALATSAEVLAMHPDDEAGSIDGAAIRTVCFMIGSFAEDALEDWVVRSDVAVRRLGFREPDEMMDAFAANRCSLLAVDAAELDGTGLIEREIATTVIKVYRRGAPVE